MFIIPKKTDSEQFYRENLMLFYPWRNETEDILKNYESYEQHNKAMEHDIISKKQEYNSNNDLVNAIETAMNTETIDNFDQVSPNIENVEAVDSEISTSVVENFQFYNPQSAEHAYQDLGLDLGSTHHISNASVELVARRLPDVDYFKLLSKLNFKQRQVFTHVVHSLVTKPCEQLLLFITGGAGVGKSVVIRVLYQAL